jgi:hypothetical protein
MPIICLKRGENRGETVIFAAHVKGWYQQIVTYWASPDGALAKSGCNLQVVKFALGGQACFKKVGFALSSQIFEPTSRLVGSSA